MKFSKLLSLCLALGFAAELRAQGWYVNGGANYQYVNVNNSVAQASNTHMENAISYTGELGKVFPSSWSLGMRLEYLSHGVIVGIINSNLDQIPLYAVGGYKWGEVWYMHPRVGLGFLVKNSLEYLGVSAPLTPGSYSAFAMSGFTSVELGVRLWSWLTLGTEVGYRLVTPGTVSGNGQTLDASTSGVFGRAALTFLL